MKKSFLITLLLALFISLPTYCQHYMFGTSFISPNDSTKKEELKDAKNKISKSLKSLMDSGNLYSYDVDFHVDEYDDKQDSTHFMIIIFAKDDPEFKEKTKAWENENPEVLEFLTNNSPSRSDEKFGDRASYLIVIKHAYASVMEVDHVDIKPDPTIDYNIIVDFTVFAKKDPKEEHSHEINPESLNWGIAEIGRLINLHVQAGIPQENINIVAAVHGLSSQSFLTDEAYLQRHKMNNPNIELIQELNRAGVEFLLCGQSLGDIKREEIIPEANITFTAQTTLSGYQMKGYALKVLKND